VDDRVAFRVAGDADLVEPVAQVGHGGQQVQRAAERAGRLLDVAGDHEHVVDAAAVQPRQDLLELRLAGDQTGGQVRHHPVAAGGQPLGDLQGAVQPLGRRRRHRHGDLPGDVLGHQVHHVAERQHLVAGPPQRPRDRLDLGCPPHRVPPSRAPAMVAAWVAGSTRWLR
jgi:hypothetical protein